jgi:hypothetical protein
VPSVYIELIDRRSASTSSIAAQLYKTSRQPKVASILAKGRYLRLDSDIRGKRQMVGTKNLQGPTPVLMAVDESEAGTFSRDVLAAARPIPLAAPVTVATLSASRAVIAGTLQSGCRHSMCPGTRV